MRGDVQAALAGIERIDGKVTGALNQAQSSPVQSRGGWHGVNLRRSIHSSSTPITVRTRSSWRGTGGWPSRSGCSTSSSSSGRSDANNKRCMQYAFD